MRKMWSSCIERSLAISLLAAACPLPAAAVPILGPTGNYYEFVASGLNWTDAKAAAQTSSYLGMQGHLVTIMSSAENTFAVNLTPADSGVWIGATDSAVEGQWRWVTGELFWSGTGGGTLQPGMFAAWDGGEPNNAGGIEDYARFRVSPRGTWNDVPLDGGGTSSSGYIVRVREQAARARHAVAARRGAARVAAAPAQQQHCNAAAPSLGDRGKPRAALVERLDPGALDDFSDQLELLPDLGDELLWRGADRDQGFYLADYRVTGD